MQHLDGDAFLVPALHEHEDVPVAEVARRGQTHAHVPQLGKGHPDDQGPVVLSVGGAHAFLARRPVGIVLVEDPLQFVPESKRQ